MLSSNFRKILVTKATLIVGTVVLGLTIGLADAHGGFNGQPGGTCDLTEQLKDSLARYEYVERVVTLQKGGVGYASAEQAYPQIVRVSYQATGSGTLDPMSSECLSCHDGSSAPLTGFSHSVGMLYPTYSRSGRYVSKGALNRRIVLIEGKVGCLSCHNPLNPAKFHLVMSNDGSKLCFACHIN